jgi:hypothetical protein
LKSLIIAQNKLETDLGQVSISPPMQQRRYGNLTFYSKLHPVIGPDEVKTGG